MCLQPNRPARPRQGIRKWVDDHIASELDWQRTLLDGQQHAFEREQIESELDIAEELDIDRLTSPNHLLKLKHAFDRIAPQQSLKVTVPGKVFHDEVESAAVQMGHRVVDFDSERFLYLVK